MGRKNKFYKKDIHQQAYETLTGMISFGDSKIVFKHTEPIGSIQSTF